MLQLISCPFQLSYLHCIDNHTPPTVLYIVYTFIHTYVAGVVAAEGACVKKIVQRNYYYHQAYYYFLAYVMIIGCVGLILYPFS